MSPHRPPRTCLVPGCSDLASQGGLCATHRFEALQRVRVTLVAGPPCSGRTSYVQEHLEPGDLIVDLDALRAALSGRPWHERPTSVLPFVFSARDAVLGRLARDARCLAGRACWIIAGVPAAEGRRDIRRRFGAKSVVLEVTAEQCRLRLLEDERRARQFEEWRGLIAKWWELYEPDDGDEVISS